MLTLVLLALLPLALLAMGLLFAAVLVVPCRLMRLPLEHVVGLLHCTPQFTFVVPTSALSQAWVVVLVLTARRNRLPVLLVPAVWVGIVYALPPAAFVTRNPAVLKVLEQLFATEQLLPLAQHVRLLVALMDSPDKVTLTAVPLDAAG